MEDPNQRLDADGDLKKEMENELNEALEDAQDLTETTKEETENLKDKIQDKLETVKENLEDTLENAKEALEDNLENAKVKAAESLSKANDVSDKMKTKLAGAWEQVGEKWEDVEESKLWDKITRFAKKAGIKLVYTSLLLWNAYQREETPRWAKRIVLGVIAYFLSPIDLIPDLAPFLGFTDDFGILGMGLVAIAGYINDDVKTKAREQLGNWFPDYDEADLKDVDEKV